jgi:hypothetical protein
MAPRKTISGLIVAGIALAGLLFFPVQTLEVRSRRTSGVMYRAKAVPGDVFTFAYIHSIEKIPVEGVFAVEDDGALRVVETRFPSYGAGLPVQAAGKRAQGEWMAAPGGERLPEFSFFISPVNQAFLRMGTRTLDLTQLVDPGDVVTVAVRRYPYLLMRLGHNE